MTEVESELKYRINFKDKKVKFKPLWDSTLHHLDDLPFNPSEKLCHKFGEYRKMVKDVKVRELFKAP